MNPTFTPKGRRMALLCLLTICLQTLRLPAQDIGITITSQRGGVNESAWPLGAADCTILMTVCNNDGGSTPVDAYRLRPILCVGGAYIKIAPDAQQTGLPPGWTILFNDGDSIRLSNGTDTWLPGECREIVIKAETIGIGGPDQFMATLGFADGNAPGDTPGPSTIDNDPNNDQAEATAMVVNVLPVPVQFNAIREQQTAWLNWSAAVPPGAWFEVQYSRDAVYWNRLATVPAANGGSQGVYNWRHTGIDGGLHYYRLKINSHAGAATYSTVRMLRAAAAGNSFIYPSPAAGQVHITVQQAGIANITSVTGRRMVTLQLQPGTNTVDVAAFVAGVYFIAIQRNGATTETHRVLVQH